ncbi:hypothetical protein NDU88_003701 [Pleurodeles waltl]|uniref:Uncharacterized protein n=1 Tax=Pleurodeles waltl TaxID=8319 RepID=A0AAV7VIJ8_PLEWA|nr:hypothetical protein NDU88_003701 [Pleurodeles waltl]
MRSRLASSFQGHAQPPRAQRYLQEESCEVSQQWLRITVKKRGQQLPADSASGPERQQLIDFRDRRRTPRLHKCSICHNERESSHHGKSEEVQGNSVAHNTQIGGFRVGGSACENQAPRRQC